MNCYLGESREVNTHVTVIFIRAFVMVFVDPGFHRLPKYISLVSHCSTDRLAEEERLGDRG